MIENIIAIAGGSGTGKSTLAYAIQDQNPEKVEVLHFDDYQRRRKDLPKLEGFDNWESPASINLDQLVFDLEELKKGNPVKVMTKSERVNPDYDNNGRLEHFLQPKELLIVEGYLSLWDERVRDMLSYSVYLDLPFKEMMKRRTKFIDPKYVEKVLKPMHEKYVESTKWFANIRLPTDVVSKEILHYLVIDRLKDRKLLP